MASLFLRRARLKMARRMAKAAERAAVQARRKQAQIDYVVSRAAPNADPLTLNWVRPLPRPSPWNVYSRILGLFENWRARRRASANMVPRQRNPITAPHNSAAQAAAGGPVAPNAAAKAAADAATAAPEAAPGRRNWAWAREDWAAFRSGWSGFWRPPAGASRWSALGGFVRADDIRSLYGNLPQDQLNWAVTAARLRRGAMLGAASLWGISQVHDLADRTFNPHRGFMMDPTNRRIDLPIVPFI